MRVLLVEDDEHLRMLVEAQLAEDAITCHAASTLEDAVQLATSVLFDAVLLDLGLPDSNGPKTTLGAIKAATRAPIVVWTGDSGPEVERWARDAGAADFLGKGAFAHHQIARALRHVHEKARLEANLAASLRREEQMQELFHLDRLTRETVPLRTSHRAEFAAAVTDCAEAVALRIRGDDAEMRTRVDRVAAVFHALRGRAKDCVDVYREVLLHAAVLVGFDEHARQILLEVSFALSTRYRDEVLELETRLGALTSELAVARVDLETRDREVRDLRDQLFDFSKKYQMALRESEYPDDDRDTGPLGPRAVKP